MIEKAIINTDESILVTGAGGFLGTYVVKQLLAHGYNKIRCFVRPTTNLHHLNSAIISFKNHEIEIVKGNLLVDSDCEKAAQNASVVYHLAAGRGKSFSGCFLDSAVTTRNLLNAINKCSSVKRFVNVSSFSVYNNWNAKKGSLLDENCPIEREHMVRYDPYAFGKIKQDDVVNEYSKRHNISVVTVRPGVVFGPQRSTITGRVGIDTFGIFLHIGGNNKIPFTYVENCADAIVMTGLIPDIDGEVFNIVDDDLPSSRRFLSLYKRNVKRFFSLYVPYRLFWLFCLLWEKYYIWSKGQIPPSFNRRMCAAYWKGNKYSNNKLKKLVNWTPKTSMNEALKRFFDYAKKD